MASSRPDAEVPEPFLRLDEDQPLPQIQGYGSRWHRCPYFVVPCCGSPRPQPLLQTCKKKRNLGWNGWNWQFVFSIDERDFENLWDIKRVLLKNPLNRWIPIIQNKHSLPFPLGLSWHDESSPRESQEIGRSSAVWSRRGPQMGSGVWQIATYQPILKNHWGYCTNGTNTLYYTVYLYHYIISIH